MISTGEKSDGVAEKCADPDQNMQVEVLSSSDFSPVLITPQIKWQAESFGYSVEQLEKAGVKRMYDV